MAMVRACSYVAEIETPAAPSEYSAIQVTVKQGNVEINKELSDLTLTEDSVMVKLSQTDTAQFTCGENAYLQIRCYKSEYDAPGSEVWIIPVRPALNDEVLP